MKLDDAAARMKAAKEAEMNAQTLADWKAGLKACNPATRLAIAELIMRLAGKVSSKS